MARRMNPFRTRRSRGTAAPAPIKVKAPTLDVNGLTEAYGWMPVDRHVGFKLAFEWYNANVPVLMYGAGVTAEQQADLDKAAKLKALGDGSQHDGEKENAWKNALRRYEKVWAGKALPKVDEAMAATEPGKNVAVLQTVLGNLNTVYNPFGVRFRLSMSAEREFAENEILLPQPELETMVSVAPLRSIINEAPTIAKVISLKTVEGVTALDGALFMANLPRVMQAVADWAVGADHVLKPVGKIYKPAGKKPAAPVPGGAGPIVRTRRWPDSAIIRVLVPGNPFKGQMQIKYGLVKDGMTIGAFKAARRALGNMGAGVGPIEDGVKKGLLTVEV